MSLSDTIKLSSRNIGQEERGPHQNTDPVMVSSLSPFSLHTLLISFVGLGRVDINRSERENVRG